MAFKLFPRSSSEKYRKGEKPGETVTVSVVCGEGIEPRSFKNEFVKGRNSLLTVTPNPGWRFAGWYDGSGTLLCRETLYWHIAERPCRLEARTERGRGIILFHTAGITKVTGEGTYSEGQVPVAEAEASAGYSFDGWYDISRCKVSGSQKYSVPGTENTVLVAYSDGPDRYIGGNGVTVTPSGNLPPEGSFTVLREYRTGDTAAVRTGNRRFTEYLIPGLYAVDEYGPYAGGIRLYRRRKVLVDGKVQIEFRWNHRGRNFSFMWETDTVAYRAIDKLGLVRRPFTRNQIREYVDVRSAPLREIAEKLMEMSRTMNAAERAEFVLRFVQETAVYEFDELYHDGMADYWKHPLETLFEGSGDCEDKALLYVTLMCMMGYRMAFLLFWDHGAAAVALDDFEGKAYFENGGRKYYFCESTTPGYRPGDVPQGFEEPDEYHLFG